MSTMSTVGVCEEGFGGNCKRGWRGFGGFGKEDGLGCASGG